MFVKANSGTDDKYYIAGHVFRIVSCLNQVLFACNNAYCINEKKAIKLLETFEYLKSATTRLYDTEAKIICIVSKKGAQCIECHHKDI